MPKVTVIPAKQQGAGQDSGSMRKRRVAAYARVSTDLEEQEMSFEAQRAYYSEYISSRYDWEFAGVYADEGLSGTQTIQRIGFRKMVVDALAGKIDLILTKSVSRFARNTVDTLSTVRQLKAKGVGVYFEKENIYTLDAKGELLITIMSSLAQEESRSISENTAWGKRKLMASGKVFMPYKNMLGFTKDKTGAYVVVPEEAEIVRLIFEMFIGGMSGCQIVKELMKRNIKSPKGSNRWHTHTVFSMLSNEKYKGDALLQKSFTTDFLSKRTKKNEGELPQYYVEGSHEAIIKPELFDLVQTLRKERRRGALRGMVICADCGNPYGAAVCDPAQPCRKVVFRCLSKYDGEKCLTRSITKVELDKVIYAALREALGKKNVLEKVRTLVPKKWMKFPEENLLDGTHPIVRVLIDKVVVGRRDIKVILRNEFNA